MKIAIIPSWYNSAVAPARGSFIKAQAEGLSARGHDVLLLIPDRDSKQKLLHVAESKESGVRCMRISVPSPWHRLFGFYLPRVLASVIKREIVKFSPNVVHAHAARPAGILAYHALRESSVPYVLTEHSGPLDAFWWTSHGKRHISLAYQHASSLFAVSNFLRGEMVKYFGYSAQKTAVLFNGVDTDLFASKLEPPMKGKLLFVGALEKDKGLHVLLNALAMLPDALEWRLTVVGSGREAESLNKRAIKLLLADQVDWLGSQPHYNMPEIYSSHDYVVVPSLHETFSMVTAEALASSRPVIASRCGGPEEVIPSYGGILFPPGDAGALAHILSSVLQGPNSFEVGRTRDHIFENFSMSNLISELESTYADLNKSGVR